MLTRLYVLVFTEHGTRRMYLGGVTARPAANGRCSRPATWPWTPVAYMGLPVDGSLERTVAGRSILAQPPTAHCSEDALRVGEVCRVWGIR
jgi:hypothetical protein